MYFDTVNIQRFDQQLYITRRSHVAMVFALAPLWA